MSDGLDRTRLPMPDPPFAGSAGRMIGDSEPDWGIIGDAGPPAGSPSSRRSPTLAAPWGFGEAPVARSRAPKPSCGRSWPMRRRAPIASLAPARGSSR